MSTILKALRRLEQDQTGKGEKGEGAPETPSAQQGLRDRILAEEAAARAAAGEPRSTRRARRREEAQAGPGSAAPGGTTAASSRPAAAPGAPAAPAAPAETVSSRPALRLVALAIVCAALGLAAGAGILSLFGGDLGGELTRDAKATSVAADRGTPPRAAPDRDVARSADRIAAAPLVAPLANAPADPDATIPRGAPPETRPAWPDATPRVAAAVPRPAEPGARSTDRPRPADPSARPTDRPRPTARERGPAVVAAPPPPGAAAATDTAASSAQIAASAPPTRPPESSAGSAPTPSASPPSPRPAPARTPSPPPGPGPEREPEAARWAAATPTRARQTPPRPPADTPTKAAEPTRRRSDAKPVSPESAPSAGAPSAPGIAEPKVAERGPIPDVHVVRTRWHPRSERRSAEIRLEAEDRALTLREGDAVGGLVIQEITPSAVLFTTGEVEIRRRVGQGGKAP